MVRPWRAGERSRPDSDKSKRPKRYHAIADAVFPGTWKAEPVPYRGRGIIYLFHGEGAEERAREWAMKKTLELSRRPGDAGMRRTAGSAE
jgi:hypothetical protein